MINSFSLVFKYILLNYNFFFLKSLLVSYKNESIVVGSKLLYFLSLHFKLSSLLSPVQLVDIFTYDIANFSSKKKLKGSNDLLSSITVYQFFMINLYYRFYIFVPNAAFNPYNDSSNLVSLYELFPGSNWLEREASELSGVFFFGKRDNRNLMLCYGDNSTPFIKSFPAVGFKEISYNSRTDLLIFTKVTLQY